MPNSFLCNLPLVGTVFLHERNCIFSPPVKNFLLQVANPISIFYFNAWVYLWGGSIFGVMENLKNDKPKTVLRS